MVESNPSGIARVQRFASRGNKRGRVSQQSPGGKSFTTQRPRRPAYAKPGNKAECLTGTAVMIRYQCQSALLCTAGRQRYVARILWRLPRVCMAED